jgi:hypothetical protein
MADCPNKERNLEMCTCTYSSCDKTGVCCDCIAYHRRMKEIPGCLFSKQGEATYDRSVSQFKKSHM